MSALLTQRDATISARAAEIDRLNEVIGQLQLAPLNGSAQAGQFRKLRALIVKELHPDQAPEGSVDRALRAEAFKAIRPKIEALSPGA